MIAVVRLRLDDGAEHSLGPGDLIGRLVTAALPLDDARISEAHALVSLRGEELRLLGLRGRFAVDGVPVREVTLRPGLRVDFAPGLGLEVVELRLPDEVLALEGDGLPLQVLAGVCSLHIAPGPRLAHRYEARADAHIWSRGDHWTLRPRDGRDQTLAAGDHFVLGGRRFAAVAVSLRAAGHSATRAGAPRPPLRIEARFDSVRMHQDGVEVVRLAGIGARIVSELVALDGPTHWRVVAGEVWRGEQDRELLRRKWDVSLFRLRKKLADAGLPSDLVGADRTGHVELRLGLDDRVIDRT